MPVALNVVWIGTSELSAVVYVFNASGGNVEVSSTS
jgi:hypothetical protein